MKKQTVTPIQLNNAKNKLQKRTAKQLSKMSRKVGDTPSYKMRKMKQPSVRSGRQIIK